MRTYKTIDLLYWGYNGKTFKNNFKNIKTGETIEQGKYPRLECFYFDETGENIFENIDDNFKTDSLRQLLNQKWEEVQQPVNFMEAIKSKKKIKVEHPLLNTDYFVLDDMLNKLCVAFLNKDIIDILANGKWYIKEDEE